MAHFKLEVEVDHFGWHIEQSEELEFAFKRPRASAVVIRNNGKPSPQNSIFGGAYCSAFAEIELPSKAEFSVKYTPKGVSYVVDPIGSEDRPVIDSVYFDLRELLDKTVSVVRWRAGLRGGPLHPVFAARFYYSSDRQIWSELSMVTSIRPGLMTMVPVLAGAPFSEEVVHLVESVGEEPLGHQLLREAWGSKAANPRSALVIGVAAAEVGLKKLIGNLIPDASWLIEEMPAPFVGKILRKFLPTLKVKGHLKGRSIRPPGELIRLIEEAIECRNKLAHAGVDPPKELNLDETLDGIRDFLWICDVYLGELWAAKFISPNTIAKWEEG